MGSDHASQGLSRGGGTDVLGQASVRRKKAGAVSAPAFFFRSPEPEPRTGNREEGDCYHLPNVSLDVPRKAKKSVKAAPVRSASRELPTATVRLAIFLAAALIVKLVVVWQLHDHILLRPDAGLDTTAYTSLARRVASGDLALGPGLYYVSPLYIYFLAVWFALSSGFTTALVVQAILGMPPWGSCLR